MKKIKKLQSFENNQLAQTELSRVYGGDLQFTVVCRPEEPTAAPTSNNDTDVWDSSTGYENDSDFYYH